LKSTSIRSHVVLLVMAVLLPGMLGVAWLIRDTFLAEQQVHVRTLRDSARAMALGIDSELLRRDTIAHVLAQSILLDGPLQTDRAQLARFEQIAIRALSGIDGWIELRSTERVLIDTRGAPFAGRSIATHALADAPRIGPLWVASAAEVAAGAVSHVPLLQPVQRGGATQYELIVTLLPAEIQRIINTQAQAPDWVGVVLDERGTVVARYPDGAAYPGHPATPDLRRHLQESREGLVQSVSLGGQPTAVYFSRAPMGWSYVAGMPSETLAGGVPGTVWRIVFGALLLLALAVVGALWLAKRIIRPVSDLRLAAQQLQSGQPVDVHATGVAECDEVRVAFAEAATAIQHARSDLEIQVAQAVQRTRLAEQHAAQGQRVAAVGRLTGGVAHDFNNLLGVISNSAHLLQRHPAAAELAGPVAAIQRAVATGSQVTQNLLRFAGRRPLRAQQLRLSVALPEMQDLLHSMLGRHVTVAVQVAADTAPVHVDAAELELALINVAMNARDAMPGGGEVRFRARNADADDLADSPTLAPGRYVLIMVGDDGVGVAPEVLTHVFEPFFTTKGLGQGSGLGLSQVHGFCTQAGGTARLESTPGLGTTVVLLLPAAGEQAALALACLPSAAKSPLGPVAAPAAKHKVDGASVLVVDDNEALSAATAAVLTAHGALVQCAADAKQALALIETGTGFDVVLSDVMMPGAMDGLALARRLRVLRPALPVILITAFSEAAAEAQGEFKVLRKPCPQDHLLHELHDAINT